MDTVRVVGLHDAVANETTFYGMLVRPVSACILFQRHRSAGRLEEDVPDPHGSAAAHAAISSDSLRASVLMLRSASQL